MVNVPSADALSTAAFAQDDTHSKLPRSIRLQLFHDLEYRIGFIFINLNSLSTSSSWMIFWMLGFISAMTTLLISTSYP